MQDFSHDKLPGDLMFVVTDEHTSYPTNGKIFSPSCFWHFHNTGFTDFSLCKQSSECRHASPISFYSCMLEPPMQYSQLD